MKDIMKERPIIMNARMVKAILEGRKTQMRRIIKPQPGPNTSYFEPRFCPYGKIGQRLWVREIFRCGGYPKYKPHEDDNIWYKADMWGRGGLDLWAWRPSIHMPRWASRILLEITDIRVERLQEITPKDSVAEGIDVSERSAMCWEVNNKKRCNFGLYWDTINARRGYSWDVNPWVFVISFRKIKEDKK